MKIAEFKTYAVGNPHPNWGGPNWVFLKLVTNDKIQGFGEVFYGPFHPRVVTRLVEDICERMVVGSDPFNIERLWRTIYSSGYSQHPDLTLLAVLSGIETACWDIVGKALNQPIYNLLGGKVHDRLRSYTYIYPEKPGDPWVFTDPDGAAKRAAYYMQKGFTALKFDPMIPMAPSYPVQAYLKNLRRAEDVVRNVREVVGDKCDILVGTHGQLTTSSAIRFAKRIEKYDPLWFEEPVPPENRDEMARVARSTSIPIASGERLSTKYEFRELLEKQAAAILQMALGRVGGILEAKKIAGMAEAYYAQIAPHLYCGPIEAAANIQLDVCSPNFLIQESIEMFGGFHAEILKKPIRWEEGYIIPPTEPGLGVELNEEVASQHPSNEAASVL
jgi:2-dehydro-3-deoxyphosphogalactonate aldolase